VRTGLAAIVVLSAPIAAPGLAGSAAACAFHYTKPEKTAVDWVIETDHLVVARSDPANEFAYQVVETLRDGGRPVEISQMVDTGTRRMLAAHPGDSVLFAYDAGQGRFRSLAYLTPAYRSVIDAVQSARDTWGTGDDAARFRMFAALQDHPEPALRALALQEIDKAPYGLLRGMALTIPTDRLLADLWTVEGYPYQSIRILLLGLTDDPAARAEIHAFIDRTAPWDWANNLGAFATALVEMDGAEGVARLNEVVLSDPAQPLDKLEQVVEALAIHNGVGPDQTRAAIGQALDQLVQVRPEAAPLVARQFSSRNDWSRASGLETLVQQRRLANAADLLTVAVYVAQARGAGALTPTPAQGG
jgi:hypothetical protein